VPARPLARLGDAPRIAIDAHGLGAIGLRRGDGDAAVTRAEVDQEIAGPDLGQPEHGIDDRMRRRLERHINAR
jgi:hypothetical protein